MISHVYSFAKSPFWKTKLSLNEVVGYFFFGGSGGGQKVFAYYGCCASVQSQALKNDFARVVRDQNHTGPHISHFWGLFAYPTQGPIGEPFWAGMGLLKNRDF